MVQTHIDRWREKSLQFEAEIQDEVTKRESLCLLGFIVMEKHIHKEAFCSTMLNIWKMKGRVEFREVDLTSLWWNFKMMQIYKKIQEGRPWTPKIKVEEFHRIRASPYSPASWFSKRTCMGTVTFPPSWHDELTVWRENWKARQWSYWCWCGPRWPEMGHVS